MYTSHHCIIDLSDLGPAFYPNSPHEAMRGTFFGSPGPGLIHYESFNLKLAGGQRKRATCKYLFADSCVFSLRNNKCYKHRQRSPRNTWTWLSFYSFQKFKMHKPPVESRTKAKVMFYSIYVYNCYTSVDIIHIISYNLQHLSSIYHLHHPLPPFQFSPPTFREKKTPPRCIGKSMANSTVAREKSEGRSKAHAHPESMDRSSKVWRKFVSETKKMGGLDVGWIYAGFFSLVNNLSPNKKWVEFSLGGKVSTLWNFVGWLV